MLPKKLKSLREGANLTQKQVADVLNVDRSTYTYYELGKSRPDMDALIQLASIFKVSVDELLDYHPKPEASESTPTVFHSGKPNYKRSYPQVALPDLDREEQNLILLYRSLHGNQQKEFLEEVRATSKRLLSKQRSV